MDLAPPTLFARSAEHRRDGGRGVPVTLVLRADHPADLGRGTPVVVGIPHADRSDVATIGDDHEEPRLVALDVPHDPGELLPEPVARARTAELRHHPGVGEHPLVEREIVHRDRAERDVGHRPNGTWRRRHRQRETRLRSASSEFSTGFSAIRRMNHGYQKEPYAISVRTR